MNDANRRNVAEIIGGTMTLMLFALLTWAYLQATPDQLSGESDCTAESAEGGAI